MTCRQSLKSGLVGTFLFTLVTILAWASAAPPNIWANNQEPLLIIFHTNDVHAHAAAVANSKGTLTQVGYARLKTYVDSHPAQHKMLLDAGGFLSGQPFASASQGDYIAQLLAIMKYDALVTGNHDFDFGLPRLMELRHQYNLNLLAANIFEKEDGSPLLPPYIIKNYGDLKVGVFALATPDTPIKTAPDNVASLNFGRPNDLLALAKNLTRKLKEEEKVDLVVALTHLGTDPLNNPGAQAVAEATPGLDLIIDGHSHSKLAGRKVGNTLIVSTGSNLNNVGEIAIRRSESGTLTLAPKLIPAAAFTKVTPDPALAALIANLAADMKKELGRIVTHTAWPLNGERSAVGNSSTNLGRIICAALKAATGADAAIFNSGSIRASIPAGDITYGQLLEVLPYGNYVLTVNLTGEQLLEALNQGLAQPDEGGFPQFYGLTATALETKKYGPDGRITRRAQAESVDIDGRPLDKKANYTIAINDFMYAGGAGYSVFNDLPAKGYATVEEVLRQYLSETSQETLTEINQADILTVIVED